MVLPPRIAESAFPAEEREAIAFINRTLTDFKSYTDTFRADVQLFDFSEAANEKAINQYQNDRTDQVSLGEYWKFHGWMFIAARDGAMNIYHFGRTRDGINATLAACPTLRKMLSDKMHLANSQFESHFSNYFQIRHGTAHVEDTHNTLRNTEKHAITSPAMIAGLLNKPASGGHVFVDGALNGRTYTCTWEGKLFSYEIREATADKMCVVRDAFYDAFKEAEMWARGVIAQTRRPSP